MTAERCEQSLKTRRMRKREMQWTQLRKESGQKATHQNSGTIEERGRGLKTSLSNQDHLPHLPSTQVQFPALNIGCSQPIMSTPGDLIPSPDLKSQYMFDTYKYIVFSPTSLTVV